MRVLATICLAVFLPIASPLLAEERLPATITVTGEGRAEAAPDLATISLGVTTQGETAGAAMDANSAALAAVVTRLKAAGIADRDVQTSNLSLNPNWQQNDGTQPPKIAGYVAMNVLTVRVRALDTLGEVLDSAITDGANTLNGISFGLDDPEPAMDKARIEAVQAAKARAELMVGAAGLKLGRVVSITEAGGYMPPMPMPMYRMEADMAKAVPVEGGEVGLTASVTMVFEIKQ
ncbi:SIMPL domain-containing protein [Gemmobacter aquarius]|uniref:SIMPL domain-containing protein n=1 Tax=Paragemmobacter aquarius TaxID=2169400 RepID=A0A2S0UN05_9RHOB|nr:SIMPL domain-containing protein [Gemmobacter aquarius]AWB49199.1 SIMPL domain-containing protein [Gemmobacter aquarius]